MIFLLVIGILNTLDVFSYAGYDDLVVMGVGCAVGGFWNPIVGGGQCSIWQPEDVGDCSICNSNPLQDCSEYQCRAIGENCRFVSGQCVDIEEDDTRSPRITNCQKISRYEEYQQGRRQPVYGEDKCEFGEVVKGKGVVAALTTDEFAKCRFDIDQNVEYADMAGIFDIFDEYSTNHYLVINPGEEATQEVIQECEDGGCRMFVKCADTAGNEMRVAYPFIFEVKGAGEDITPPRIEFGSVDDGFVIKKGDHVLDFGMLVSDESGVSECRYSRGEDLEFDQMGIMSCRGTYPTACGATLTNIQD
ncbi:MAG: hypothetical protein HY361_01630, partial [Candidatus Aenigmarchaeota archaeon]|nr:hypothetical protein [Candidatus Aenigmarchaeota archaeon]